MAVYLASAHAAATAFTSEEEEEEGAEAVVEEEEEEAKVRPLDASAMTQSVALLSDHVGSVTTSTLLRPRNVSAIHCKKGMAERKRERERERERERGWKTKW
jgi:hypothetical protein